MMLKLATCFFGTDKGVFHVALAWETVECLKLAGGSKTVTVDIARKQNAEVRIRPITRRHDLYSILRPAYLPWTATQWLQDLEYDDDVVIGPEHFTNLPPLTEWLDDGRSMQLKRPFGYISMNDRVERPYRHHCGRSFHTACFLVPNRWTARRPYRNASIVHDHFCDIRTQPWPDVHRMFHDAMLCSGVPYLKARIMFYAVYRFGPRWINIPSIELASFGVAKSTSMVSTDFRQAFDADSFIADCIRIEQENLDLPAIELLADSRTSAIKTWFTNACDRSECNL
jgi:hypothetical protein